MYQPRESKLSPACKDLLALLGTQGNVVASRDDDQFKRLLILEDTSELTMFMQQGVRQKDILKFMWSMVVVEWRI
jgi:hypothetical protein